MAGALTIQNNPPFLNARTGIYTAWSIRGTLDDFTGPGVADYESFRVKQRGAGANLSADIGNTAINRACIRGTTRDGQGFYFAENVDYTAPTANTMLAQINTGTIFTTGDATNPRIDQVFLRILDQQHDGGASNLLQVQVVDGVATGGATLDNRTGVGAVPANSILLADVLMPALASTVTTANIRDRRAYPLPGTSGLAGTAPLTVPVAQPIISPCVARGDTTLSAMPTTNQAAVLVYLPNRIAAATRIRWTYRQGGTAATGNYVIGIYDASGRKIIDTGSVAYTGTLNTIQNRSETITATTFEPGNYYVLFGHTFAVGTIAGIAATFTANQSGYPIPAQMVALGSGSAVAPQTILGFADLNVGNAAAFVVPVIALTVG